MVAYVAVLYCSTLKGCRSNPSTCGGMRRQSYNKMTGTTDVRTQGGLGCGGGLGTGGDGVTRTSVARGWSALQLWLVNRLVALPCSPFYRQFQL